MCQQLAPSTCLDADTVRCRPEAVHSRGYRDWIRLLQGFTLHLHTHRFSPPGYTNKYGAVILLRLLLQTIVSELQERGLVIVYRLQPFLSFWYLFIFVSLVVV